MGVAAIVIDLGMMRLAQRQMQSASQTAALEALTFRDSVDGFAFSGRNASSDTNRRQSAADRVAEMFDDDFDTASDSRNFGAGPNLSLTGGVAVTATFQGSQDLAIPQPPVYKPDMQLNTANQDDGDFVAGTFIDKDLQPAVSGNALLARLRRTDESLTSGVGHSGGNIPFLFGRGSLLSPELRGRGVAVRAESIADARPAVQVGEARTINGVNIPGAIDFGIASATWAALPPNTPTPVGISATTAGTLASTVTEIGQTANLQASPLAGTAGYCPIVANLGGTSVAVGFGWAALGTFDGTNLEITKLVDPSSPSGSVAPRNASARLSEVWNNIGSTIRDDVINANRALVDPLRAPLLVH